VVREAVVDADHHAPAVVEERDTDERAEGPVEVGGGEAVLVIDLAARGAVAVVAGPVPGRDAGHHGAHGGHDRRRELDARARVLGGAGGSEGGSGEEGGGGTTPALSHVIACTRSMFVPPAVWVWPASMRIVSPTFTMPRSFSIAWPCRIISSVVISRAPEK
jgi:hypothetical protein